MCIAAMCIACFDRVLILTQYQLSAVISHRGLKEICAMYIENKRLYYNILSVVEIYCVDYFKTHLADQQQKIIINMYLSQCTHAHIA